MRKIIFGNRFRYFFSRNQFAASLWWAHTTLPIIMMNLDILESDKAQSVPKLVSALWLCVTNGEAAVAACDIVSRDPDRAVCDILHGVMWKCAMWLPHPAQCSVHSSPSRRKWENMTLSGLVQVQVGALGALSGEEGTVLVIPLNQDLAFNEWYEWWWKEEETSYCASLQQRISCG